MKQWFGPGPCSVLGGEMDFRVGGRYLLLMRTETMGDVAVGGVYREISRPARIAFSWQWEPNPELCTEEMEIVIDLADFGGETELSLTQTGFPNRDMAEHHGIGWNGTLDCLGPFLKA